MRTGMKKYKVKLNVDGKKSELLMRSLNVNGVLTQLKSEILDWNYKQFNDLKTVNVEINCIEEQ